MRFQFTQACVSCEGHKQTAYTMRGSQADHVHLARVTSFIGSLCFLRGSQADHVHLQGFPQERDGETPDKFGEQTQSSERTPDKLDAPLKTVGNLAERQEKPNPFAPPEKKAPPPSPVAYFDFQTRQAYMFESGKKIFSKDFFQADQEKGEKSPIHVAFSDGGKKIVAHLAGMWYGALDIGGRHPLPRAPVVRIMKFKAKPKSVQAKRPTRKRRGEGGPLAAAASGSAKRAREPSVPEEGFARNISELVILRVEGSTHSGCTNSANLSAVYNV